MMKPEALSKAAKEVKPVRMACLDVALSSLPQKDAIISSMVETNNYDRSDFQNEFIHPGRQKHA